MKKIPYGISSYDKIKSENYYFVDKTKYSELIEAVGSPLKNSKPLKLLWWLQLISYCI